MDSIQDIPTSLGGLDLDIYKTDKPLVYLSIVVPLYNEEDNAGALIEE